MSHMKDLQIRLDNIERERTAHLTRMRYMLHISKEAFPNLKLRCPSCFSVIWLCTHCVEFVCVKCSCHGSKQFEFLEEIWPEKEN